MTMEHKKPIVVVPGLMRKDALAELEKHCEVRQWDKAEPMPRELLKEWLVDADALVVVKCQVDGDLIEGAKNLKVVAQAAVGYDNVSIEDLTARRIPYGNTPRVLDESVAELAMGLTICASRRIVENVDYVRSGKWMDRYPDFKGIDLSRATMGIIGMGNIGLSISRRARAFGMTVIYHNRNRRKDDHLYMTTYVSLDELLEKSDVVMCVLPLTKETEKLIGKEFFQKMKKSSLFVNVGRGKVVDTDALAEALQSGEIDYAALDVVDPEPFSPNHPLLKTGKCIITPHVASYTNRTRKEMAFLMVENILRGIKEEPLATCVNEAVNYKKEG